MVKECYVLDPLHEIQCILSHFKKRKMYMDESIIVFSIVYKLPPSWKNTKRTLEHMRIWLTIFVEEELTMHDKSK